ncbi:hypothetical protein [Sphingobacterium sp. BIGb0165]|uniref:hypothetical protein n=1 Tax=Sphingobacterium sp. BIGb0165 TaxID=2940615 RepID=UPI00216A8189|nr:hypothetical protein [Sphingobacterium sp. BIGb0165]MCS4227018.1 hypothetical protein [Sphingobacterium sp. BIGb0165]
MKKLIFAGIAVVSFAALTPDVAKAQQSASKQSLEISAESTPQLDFQSKQKLDSQTDAQGRRGPGYWTQLFNAYLDVYLKYGYSANDAIERAHQSVYREIEIYYGVDL